MTQRLNQSRRPFRILTVTVFIALIVPALVQDGMFVDGVTYGAISRNMAQGMGSAWCPHYTKTLYPVFYEQPPLVFMVQSCFFRVLGDSIYTERVFSFLMAVLTAWGIVLVWRLFNKNKDQEKYSWVPVFLWITIPLVSWSYRNNLLENFVSVAALFSVWFISRSFIEKKIVYLFPGSVMIFLAFLSKGPVGLFPLVTPMLLGLAFGKKEWKRSGFYNLYLILLTLALFFLLLKLIPASGKNLKTYLDQQLFPAIYGQREVTTNSRFSILGYLMLELSFPVLFLLYFSISRWLKTRQLNLPDKRTYLFFLLTGLAASIPFIITLKQRRFYLVPSLPFYILSISCLVVPYLKKLLEKISQKKLKWIGRSSYIILGMVLIFSVTRFGRYSRDEVQLKDIYVITEVIPWGSVVGSTEDLCTDWRCVAYMCRTGYLSLEPDKNHTFFLLKKDKSLPAPLREEYDKMNLDLAMYTLLKRKE